MNEEGYIYSRSIWIKRKYFILINFLPSGVVKDTILLDGIIKILGKGFINAIKMLVVPLVFVSITCGVASLSDI